METNRLITIGTLSQRTEVNIETIRYYERIGILPKCKSSSCHLRLSRLWSLGASDNRSNAITCRALSSRLLERICRIKP